MKQNKKPIIGIIPTFNFDEIDPYKDTYNFVSLYTEIIIENGGIPLGILSKDINLYIDLCDGYLWPGGNKIYKEFYQIIDDAIKNKKPVLGICLGAQSIATYFNVLEGKLDDKANSYLNYLGDNNVHNHIVTKDIKTINSAKHKIKINNNSLLSKIYKRNEMDVVSLHSYEIANVSKYINISARADDLVIEAIEYTKDDNNILGVMFHPEIIKDNKLFKWLIDEASKEDLCQK